MPSSATLSGANGINVIRLGLVLLVILSHSYTLGRYAPSPDWLGQTPGRWALAGLFAVSGFLVVSGAYKMPIGQFVWTRIVRLWPAFYICLLVIACIFAPFAYIISNLTIDGYLTSNDGPLRFLFVNAFFEMRQTVISGTPDRFGWSGNLWTIVYTVWSYIVIAILLVRAHARYSTFVVAIAWVISCVVHANMDVLMSYLQSGQAAALFRFLPYFLGGAMVGLVKHKMRLSPLWGVLALIAGVGFSAYFPQWGTQVAAPLFAYGLISIGLAFRAPEYLRKNDYSLGFFMYSFAVQKVLRILGVNEIVGDPVAFFVASVVATAPFAILSWHLIERPLIVSRRSQVSKSPPAASEKV